MHMSKYIKKKLNNNVSCITLTIIFILYNHVKYMLSTYILMYD